MTAGAFRAEPVGPEWARGLADLFRALCAAGDDRTFHPHPLTAEEAKARSEDRGRDVYLVGLSGDHVVGYGFLRGWDEGYAVPSLGIAIHPEARGCGFGKALMLSLHDAARDKGARQIRLRVAPDNHRARKLYESLGYRFRGEDRGEHVGLLELCPDSTSA